MKEQMTGPIIHIGMHKTATTFLQTEVFPRLEGFHYVGPPVAMRGLLTRPAGKRLLISDEYLSGVPWRHPPLDRDHDWETHRKSVLD